MAQAPFAQGSAAGLSEPLMGNVPSTDVQQQPRSKWPQGMVEPGNINLYDRPTVHNADQTISSVRSMSFEENGKEVLVPTVSDDGRILTELEAREMYHKTGKHLGKFQDAGVLKAWQHADSYATALHNEYAAGKYGKQRSGQNVSDVQTTPFNTTVPRAQVPFARGSSQ